MSLIINPVAKRLKEARLIIGLSQKELGIRAGIDPSSASPRVNQYETGKHTPDFNTCTKLCEVLDVPVAFFYAEDDELAQLIKIFHALSHSQKNNLLKELSAQKA